MAENQRPEVEQLARTRGFTIADIFEEAVSATKKRPEYERMMTAARKGKLDTIVVWSIDRLGRSMAGNLNAVLELDRIGVDVISVREGWLDASGPVRSLLRDCQKFCVRRDLSSARRRERCRDERRRAPRMVRGSAPS